MKNFCLLLLSIICIVSCQPDNENLLDKTMEFLGNLEAFEYNLVTTYTENERVAFQKTEKLIVEYQSDKSRPPKYRMYDNERDFIFDGVKATGVNHIDEIIIDNSLENISPYNPLYHTVVTLKDVLPQLRDVENKAISLSQRDTFLLGKEVTLFDFHLEGQWVNFEKRELIAIESGNRSWNMMLFVERKSGIPVMIKSTNGENGFSSGTVEDFRILKKDEVPAWQLSDAYSNYKRIKNQEYKEQRVAALNKYVFTQMDEWKLPSFFDKTEVNTKSLKGDVVVYEFWYKGCGPCKAAIPRLNVVNKKYKDRDFKMYGVEFGERNTTEELESYLNKNKKEYPNVHTGKSFAQHHGVYGAPTIMIVDKTGKIIYAEFGFNEDELYYVIDSVI